MAITSIDPPEFTTASTVQVDCDASDHAAAVDEIDEWARMNGFARTPDYWLLQVIVGERRYFRGICYRPVGLARSA